MAIKEAAFFYPSDLVNTKTTIPSGSVKCGGYVPRRFASRYISTTIHLPFELYNIPGSEIVKHLQVVASQEQWLQRNSSYRGRHFPAFRWRETRNMSVYFDGYRSFIECVGESSKCRRNLLIRGNHLAGESSCGQNVRIPFPEA